MDDLIPALRMLERIIVVGFGGLSIYLGYKLFFHLPHNVDHQGKFELPGIKIILSKVGPGVFFCAFGSVVLLQSLFEEVQVKKTSTVEKGQEDQAYNQVTEGDYFAGASAPLQGEKSEQSFSLRISVAHNYVAQLNCLIAKEQGNASAIKTQNTLDIAKFALYKLAWDDSQFGSFRDFMSNPQTHSLASEFNTAAEEC